jgi:peroxiredoxin
MSEEKKDKGLFIAVVISALILLAAVIWASKKYAEPQPADMPNNHDHSAADHQHEHDSTTVQQGISSSQESQETSNSIENTAGSSSLTLQQIAQMAQKSGMWSAYYNDWFGKQAPDFTMTDINGKEHKLSDYKGKEVILVFWATWCPPCRIEIPHLIELRNLYGQDKLAILAISNEPEDLVKNFAKSNNLNYTVLLSISALSAPYSYVNSIPSSFFIDSEGKIKFGTVGTLDLEAMKAIVEAKQ